MCPLLLNSRVDVQRCRGRGNKPFGCAVRHTFGSWTNALPLLEFGGHSPVTAYCSASMTVCETRAVRMLGFQSSFEQDEKRFIYAWDPFRVTSKCMQSLLTVFPAPFWPTIKVSGVSNCRTTVLSGLKDLMPLIRSLCGVWGRSES